jgi:hypothetical protein
MFDASPLPDRRTAVLDPVCPDDGPSLSQVARLVKSFAPVVNLLDNARGARILYLWF